MAIEDHSPVASVKNKQSGMELLREQVALLTEQVAMLSTSSGGTASKPQRYRICCFSCNHTGHVQRECNCRRATGLHRCFVCGQIGHIAKDCCQ